MIRVDAEGIPRIVQSISFGEMAYKIKLFTGQSVLIDIEQLIPQNQPHLSDESFHDVEQLFLTSHYPFITNKLEDRL